MGKQTHPAHTMLLLLLGVFLLLATTMLGAANAIDCEAGCATCLPPINSSWVADVVNDTVYVAPVDEFTYQNGTFSSPFSSIPVALDAIKNLAENITIIVLPGNYTVTEEYAINAENFASLQNYQFGLPRGGITTRRTINLVGSGGSSATRVSCALSSTNVLLAASQQVGFTLTLTLNLEGFTFKGCNRAIAFSGEAISVKNCVFKNLKFPTGALQIATTYEAQIENTTFLDNAGDVYIQRVLSVSVKGCVFTHTYPVQGGTTAQLSIAGPQTGMTVVVENCQFTGSVLGGLLASLVPSISVLSSTFTNCKTLGLYFYSSVGVIENCKFLQGREYLYSARLTKSQVQVSNCQFENNVDFQFGLVVATEGTVAILKTCTFSGNDGRRYLVGLIFVESGSSMTMENFTSVNDQGRLGSVGRTYITIQSSFSILSGSITGATYPDTGFVAAYSTVSITNLSFNGMTSANSLLAFFRSQGSMTNVTVQGNTDSNSLACGAFRIIESNMTLSQVNVENSSVQTGGAICIQQSLVVTLSNSVFKDNHAETTGGAVYCDSSNIEISQVEFLRNSVPANQETAEGGALYITGPSTGLIHDCHFENNSATLGGAVSVYVENNDYHVTFVDNEFISNFASKRGGALYSGSSDFLPDVSPTNNTFVGNEAVLSGSNLAGPAKRFEWVLGNAPSLTVKPSGLYLPEFTIVLKDTYGAKVFLSETECFIIKVHISLPNSARRSENGAETIGEIQKAIIEGQVTFSNLRVAGTPGSYNVSVQSNVDNFDREKFLLVFPVVITPCEPGYILQPITESDYGVCTKAICSQGCLFGICMDQDTCVCNEGYDGDRCQHKSTAPYYPNYSQAGPVVVVAFCGLFIAVAVFFGVSIVIFRGTPVIKSASPAFCVITLFGMVIGYVGVITFVGLPSTALCVSNLWLINIAFVVAFGSILAKNWRIYRIFGNRHLRVISVHTSGLLMWIFGTFVIEAVLLIIWSAYDPPTFVEIETDEGDRYFVCGSTVDEVFTRVMLIIVICFNAVITIFAAWLAFVTRHISSAFNDSRGIALSVYNFGIIAVIVLPMIYAGSSFSVEAIFYIKAVSVLVVITFAMLAFYGPKIYVIYFAKEKNVLPKDALGKGSNSAQNGQLNFSGGNPGAHVEMVPLETADTEVPSYGGSLAMQIGVMKLWRPRYIEIHAQTGVITIFEDESKAACGIALFAGKISVLNREDHSPGCFTIQTQDTSYLFEASDQAAADAWIHKLNDVRQLFMREEDRRGLNSTHPT